MSLFEKPDLLAKTKTMKKILLILSVIVMVSCSSDDDAGDVITTEFERINDVLPQGTWYVSKLIDDNEDRTLAFEEFIFTFDGDGTVAGETDLFTETGTWRYQTTSQNGEQLILDFNSTTPFDMIDDDWTIISLTNSKVELSDDEENDDDPDLLVFTKL